MLLNETVERSRLSIEPLRFSGELSVSVPEVEPALLEWSDLSYFVPNSAVQKAQNYEETHANLGLPMPEFSKVEGQLYRQILTKQTGYVKPFEMVAILGPSGSGKTSLLNVLS